LIAIYESPFRETNLLLYNYSEPLDFFYYLCVTCASMSTRNKGCITCKSRKVKCDLSTPNCERCIQSGVVCRGYTSAVRFVDERPRLNRSIAVVQAQEQSQQQLQKTAQHMYHSGYSQRTSNSGAHTILYESMPVLAFKDDVLLSFLASKIFQGRSHCQRLVPGSQFRPPVIPCGSRGSWMVEIAKSPNISLRALAEIFFGPAHHLHDMKVSALQLYGKALTDMRRRLIASDSLLDFETAASMTMLCMFEVQSTFSLIGATC
jgi:Fungal Zn(2)-Cys(6) binuclear cluster domain